jgi:hypothetical protein
MPLFFMPFPNCKASSFSNHRLFKEFDEPVEVIECRNGDCLVVARSLKDGHGIERWQGRVNIEHYIHNGIPEAALKKYGSPETLLNLQKETEQVADPVEVTIVHLASVPVAALPCPFCGGDPEVVEDDGSSTSIFCDNIFCRIQPTVYLCGEKDETFADLLLHWNNRPNEC